MVTDVAQQQTGIGPVHDQPDVATHPDRPESAILGLFELVELQARMRRIQLEIESCGLYGLLFVASKPGEAFRERVCDAEVHLRRCSPPSPWADVSLPSCPATLTRFD